MTESSDDDFFHQPFVEFWSEHFGDTNEISKRRLTELRELTDRPALSSEQKAALSRAMETYLRSREFLGAMRHVIQWLIQSRRQSSDFSVLADLRGQLPIWSQFIDLVDAAPNRNKEFGATPFDVVSEAGALRLLRFQSPYRVTAADPVLICSSLINRPYIVDLHKERSVVRQLLQAGLNVYLIDWGTPNSASSHLGLRDYVCGFMKQFADATCKDAQSNQCNLLGYCMGGTMSTMFTALYGDQIRNLILLAAPIDFAGRESLLNLWTREEYFDVDGLIDAFGNCPGWFLRICFQQMKPVQNYVQNALTLRDKFDDDAFLENFFAVERWANDSIPVAGETFRQFIKWFYQRNQLIQGTIRLGKRLVDLSRIDCPVLILTADYDHLVPPSSTWAIKDHVNSSEIRGMQIDAGHIGLAVSSRAQHRMWPNAAAWITEHSSLL